MDYSIIIPYRNRATHLDILLPRLKEVFKDKSFEIIVSEQDDTNAFQIACVENVGFIHSTGETVILNQVDYWPGDDVSYEVGEYPVLPARKGIFVTEDTLSLREMADIPQGYRNFATEIDPKFYGGVIAMRRHHFEAINGLNPLYKGWGNEDEDLRERFVWAGIPVVRNQIGTFYVLHHEDNGKCSWGPEHPGYANFIEGRRMFENGRQYKDIGYRSMTYTHAEIIIEGVRWIKSTNYKLRA